MCNTTRGETLNDITGKGHDTEPLENVAWLLFPGSVARTVECHANGMVVDGWMGRAHTHTPKRAIKNIQACFNSFFGTHRKQVKFENW